MGINIDIVNTNAWTTAGGVFVIAAGAVPLYLYYSKPPSERDIALNAIDDPHGTYVYHGLPLGGGKRILRLVKVPNLHKVPHFDAAGLQPRRSRASQHTSATGWVNFAHILGRFGCRFERGDFLEYDKGRRSCQCIVDGCFSLD